MGTGLTCALLLSILGALPAEQRSAPTTVASGLVSVERRQFSARDGIGTIEVDILNKTKVQVTAWLVSVNYTLSNGDKGQQGILRDEYSAHLLPPRADAGPVGPNGVRRDAIVIPLPAGMTLEAVSVELTMVVFEDDTWSGDALSAKYLFEKRGRETRVWGVIAEAMRQGRDVGGQAGLKKALDHLEQSTSEVRQDPSLQTIRRNLERALAWTLKVNPDDFLRTWVDRANEREQIAAAHLQPKGIRSGGQ